MNGMHAVHFASSRNSNEGTGTNSCCKGHFLPCILQEFKGSFEAFRNRPDMRRKMKGCVGGGKPPLEIPSDLRLSEPRPEPRIFIAEPRAAARGKQGSSSTAPFSVPVSRRGIVRRSGRLDCSLLQRGLTVRKRSCICSSQTHYQKRACAVTIPLPSSRVHSSVRSSHRDPNTFVWPVLGFGDGWDAGGDRGAPPAPPWQGQDAVGVGPDIIGRKLPFGEMAFIPIMGGAVACRHGVVAP